MDTNFLSIQLLLFSKIPKHVGRKALKCWRGFHSLRKMFWTDSFLCTLNHVFSRLKHICLRTCSWTAIPETDVISAHQCRHFNPSPDNPCQYSILATWKIVSRCSSFFSPWLAYCEHIPAYPRGSVYNWLGLGWAGGLVRERQRKSLQGQGKGNPESKDWRVQPVYGVLNQAVLQGFPSRGCKF